MSALKFKSKLFCCQLLQQFFQPVASFRSALGAVVEMNVQEALGDEVLEVFPGCRPADADFSADLDGAESRATTLVEHRDHRIEGILSKQQNLFPLDSNIEQLAQSCAARIIVSRKEVDPSESDDYREVDLDSLEMSRPRSVGAGHITLESLLFSGIDEKLKELGFNGPQTAAAIGTIIGRCCEPGSELATHTWLQKRSGLGDLLDYDFSNLSLYGMYMISDQLFKNKAAIERHVYERERSLFGLRETITLYDLTNTYFEGEGKANGLAARGHSKEKRTDCPLVTLGLVLDSSGFPRRSQVYEGNVSEPKTLAEMLRNLEGGDTSTGPKPTVVMDAGIATDDNVAWLREHEYPYLVVSRKRHREFAEESSVVVKKDDECTVRVQKVFDEKTQETLLYCHSSQREKKDQAIDDRITSRLEEALQKLASGLAKKRCLKKYHRQLSRGVLPADKSCGLG